MQFLATCPKGIEPFLRDECREAGLRRVRTLRGSVRFEGDTADGMRACLWLRTAHRVLLPLATTEAGSADALYEGARKVPWEDHITLRHTFAIHATGTNPALRHTHFAALRVKDAIVDRLRESTGARPSVDPREPDVRIVARVSAKSCDLSLDLSGDSLHRRGYRVVSVEAPLRETLAAAILRASGWDRQMPIVDPMCGGATLLIEAALLARRIAPGLGARHGFMRWPTYGDEEARTYARLMDEARSVALPAAPAVIRGTDRDPAAIDAARKNARAAGVARDITLSCEDGANLTMPQAPGVIVTNPPYGERLGEIGRPMQDFFRRLGTGFRRYQGYTAYILSGNEEFPKQFGMRYTGRLALWNGPIACSLYRYDL